MPSPEQVRATVESYVELLGAGERSKWLDLFAADATVVDPVPSAPHRGRAAIKAFWTGMTGMADHLQISQHTLHICGDQAALVYTLTLAKTGGGGLVFDGVEIFVVAEDGLITSAHAYWDPAEIRQLEAGNDL